MRARAPGERVFEKYVVDSNGCWLWSAGRDAQGYGRLKANGRAALAHRIAYETAVGPIPEGLELDHICGVRACINPDHLEPVTHRVNVLRGGSPAAVHAKKQKCLRGHDLAKAHVDPNGRRVCYRCLRERRALR